MATPSGVRAILVKVGARATRCVAQLIAGLGLSAFSFLPPSPPLMSSEQHPSRPRMSRCVLSLSPYLHLHS